LPSYSVLNASLTLEEPMNAATSATSGDNRAYRRALALEVIGWAGVAAGFALSLAGSLLIAEQDEIGGEPNYSCYNECPMALLVTGATAWVSALPMGIVGTYRRGGYVSALAMEISGWAMYVIGAVLTVAGAVSFSSGNNSFESEDSACSGMCQAGLLTIGNFALFSGAPTGIVGSVRRGLLQRRRAASQPVDPMANPAL